MPSRLYHRSLAICESLGPDCTTSRRSHQPQQLGVALPYPRQVCRAERATADQLAMSEKRWGPDHPNVATTLENLAAS